jgi:hypothetical protein
MSPDLSFLHDFAEFYVAGFRFSDTFLQYWGLTPSEITLVFGFKGVRNSEPCVSRFIIFAWFCGILCCRVQIFWHLFTISGPKAFRNHFSIWLLRGSEILNPVSRDLSFLHDFAGFYVAGFRFSDTFFVKDNPQSTILQFLDPPCLDCFALMPNSWTIVQDG